MPEERIDIATVCQANTVTREHGKVIHDLIVKIWDTSDVITIDFNNVLIASVSFLDEAFGGLTDNRSVEEIARKLKLVNMKPFDRNLANSIVQSRLTQKEVQRAKG